jgi:hypothetical protein
MRNAEATPRPIAPRRCQIDHDQLDSFRRGSRRSSRSLRGETFAASLKEVRALGRGPGQAGVGRGVGLREARGAPHSHRPVAAARDQGVTCGNEGHGIHQPLMPSKGSDFLSRGQIEEGDGQGSRVSLTDWVVITWLIVLGLPAWCASRETDQPYDRVYALMWRLIEAVMGQEADRRLSGTIEVDEIYVSCGHKGKPEDDLDPKNPLSPLTLGREVDENGRPR